MASSATQPDTEAPPAHTGQEKAAPAQEPATTEQASREPKQLPAEPPAPLPPSHSKVRFDPEAQVVPQSQYYSQYVHSQPTVLPFSRPWHLAKLALITMSIIFSLVIVSLGIYLASATVNSYLGAFEFGFTSAAAGAALVWNALEFIVLCASRQQPAQGIHPGAHVGVHLIIWLYSAVVVGFLGAFASERDYYYDDDDLYLYQSAYDTERTLFSFTVLLLAVHFFLFVRACVETHERNKTPRTTTTVYVPVAMNPNEPYNGYGYGYYNQAPNPVQIPPEVARQMAPGQNAVLPPTLTGYYAPPAPTRAGARPPMPPHHQPAYQGYYAPQAAPMPQRSSMRQPSPPAVSPAPERAPQEPPVAPSPVSAA